MPGCSGVIVLVIILLLCLLQQLTVQGTDVLLCHGNTYTHRKTTRIFEHRLSGNPFGVLFVFAEVNSLFSGRVGGVLHNMYNAYIKYTAVNKVKMFQESLIVSQQADRLSQNRGGSDNTEW